MMKIKLQTAALGLIGLMTLSRCSLEEALIGTAIGTSVAQTTASIASMFSTRAPQDEKDSNSGFLIRRTDAASGRCLIWTSPVTASGETLLPDVAGDVQVSATPQDGVVRSLEPTGFGAQVDFPGAVADIALSDSVDEALEIIADGEAGVQLVIVLNLPAESDLTEERVAAITDAAVDTQTLFVVTGEGDADALEDALGGERLLMIADLAGVESDEDLLDAASEAVESALIVELPLSECANDDIVTVRVTAED